MVKVVSSSLRDSNADRSSRFAWRTSIRKSPPEFNFFGGGTIRQMLETQNEEMQVVNKRIGYVVRVSMLTLAFLVVTKLPTLIAPSRVTNPKIEPVEFHQPAMKSEINSIPDEKPAQKTEGEPLPQPAQVSTTPPPNPVQANGALAPVGNVRSAPEVNPQKVETPAPPLSPVPPSRMSSPDTDSKSAIEPTVDHGSKTAPPIDAPAGPASIIEGASSNCASPQSGSPPSCVGRIRAFFRFRLVGTNS